MGRCPVTRVGTSEHKNTQKKRIGLQKVQPELKRVKVGRVGLT